MFPIFPNIQIIRFNPDSDTPLEKWAVVDLLDGSAHGRVLKESAAGRVVVVHHEGRPFVVKRYAMNWFKASLYNAVRRTPAWREWHGARRLARAGVRVAMPVALVHHPFPLPWKGGVGGGSGVESGREAESRMEVRPSPGPSLPREGNAENGPVPFFAQSLVLPYVEGVSLNHFLADAAVGGERRLLVLRRVGEQAAAMAAAGIANRDHKAPNLLVDAEAASGARPPCVIDAAGLRRATPERVRRMMELLVRSAGALRPLTGEEEQALRGAIFNEK